MKTKQNIGIKMIGWLLFLFAIGFFCLQMGYLLVHTKFQVEYIDDRIFYIINMMCVICLALAILLGLTLTKKWKWICASIVTLFVIVNGVLLVTNNQEIKNITNISPDNKHVLSLKINTVTGETIYYRNYFGILARPKVSLPYKAVGDFKVEWLANDVAAVTYKEENDTIHQFIATYGSRGGGGSYYNVAPEIHGRWQGENVEVISDTKGISVTQDNKTELFESDHIVQFGTIAIVLTRGNEAVWTISLNESIEIDTSTSALLTGEISLYKATMEKNKQIILYDNNFD